MTVSANAKMLYVLAHLRSLVLDGLKPPGHGDLDQAWDCGPHSSFVDVGSGYGKAAPTPRRTRRIWSAHEVWRTGQLPRQGHVWRKAFPGNRVCLLQVLTSAYPCQVMGVQSPWGLCWARQHRLHAAWHPLHASPPLPRATDGPLGTSFESDRAHVRPWCSSSHDLSARYQIAASILQNVKEVCPSARLQRSSVLG